MVTSLLDDDGISTDLLHPVPRQAVTAAISVGGDRAMVSSGTNGAPPLTGAAPSLLMSDLRSLEANRETVSRWRDEGTYVIGDVGWDDSGLWDSGDLAPLDLVDIFVPNEEEACNYTRAGSAISAAEQLAELVPTVVVTRGPNGTVVAGDDGHGGNGVNGSFALPAYPARTVDPTGAGDVFSAVLAWGVAQGVELRQAISAASLAGALSTERLGGAGAPTLGELRERAFEASRDPEWQYAGFDLSLLTTPDAR